MRTESSETHISKVQWEGSEKGISDKVEKLLYNNHIRSHMNLNLNWNKFCVI